MPTNLPPLPGLPVVPSLSNTNTLFTGAPVNSQFVDYTKGFTPGYVLTTIDKILQQYLKSQHVTSTKILDYHQAENDPNFSRKTPQTQNTLNLQAGNLAIASTLTTLMASQLKMLGVQEAYPTNVRNGAVNLNSVKGSGISTLPASQQNLTFTNITTMVLADLTSFFTTGKISFTQIAQMGTLLAGSPAAGVVSNNGLSPVMSSSMKQTLPNNMTAILTSVNMIASLIAIFGTGSPLIAQATESYSSSINDMQDTLMSDMVANTSDYSDVPLTLQDPYGINLQNQFQAESQTNYIASLNTMVAASATTLGLTAPQQTQISTLLVQDAQQNFTQAFAGTLGLPSLPLCVQAIKSNAYNSTIAAINTAFNTFSNNVITQAGLNLPSDGTAPFDYLINVKKFLEQRVSNSNAVTVANYDAINSYLMNAIPGQDLSQENLVQLNSYLAGLNITSG